MEQVVLKDALEIVIKDGIVPDSIITVSKEDGKLLIRRKVLADPKNTQHILFREV